MTSQNTLIVFSDPKLHCNSQGLSLNVIIMKLCSDSPNTPPLRPDLGIFWMISGGGVMWKSPKTYFLLKNALKYNKNLKYDPQIKIFFQVSAGKEYRFQKVTLEWGTLSTFLQNPSFEREVPSSEGVPLALVSDNVPQYRFRTYDGGIIL